MSNAAAAHPSSTNRPTASRITPDARLRSTPDTVLRGCLAANLSPALTINPGQIVEVETLSHQGLTTDQDPAKFFGAVDLGIGEAVDIVNLVYAKIPKKIFRHNPSYWFQP